MINTRLIKDLNSYFEERPNYLGGKVPDDEILQAEKNLNLSFAESYKEFLQKYGDIPNTIEECEAYQRKTLH